MSLPGKRLDLTGQRYGRLVALRPAEKIGRYTAWLCRCDCGNEIVVATRKLRNGHTKSCGCMGKGPVYVDGTCADMLRAAKIARKNNTSGVPGVEWRTSKQSWQATICFKGKRHYLGSYKNFDEAVRARKRAEEEMHDKFLAEYAEEHPLKANI